MKSPTVGRNSPHDFRETWLHAAVDELRIYFNECFAHEPSGKQLSVPENIRVAIGFPSTGRKGRRESETWHAMSSSDNSYEIFIRPDKSEPVQVLGALVKELVHAALPDIETHGKLYKGAAQKVGLHGKMRNAEPGLLLERRLRELAAKLGPLPHATLDISGDPLTAVSPPIKLKPIGQVKKRGGQYVKAECHAEGCPYIVRVAKTHVRDIGAPVCPKHGPMHVNLSDSQQEDETEPSESEAVTMASRIA